MLAQPALEFIGPYQTVCNYGVYFLHALGEHMALVSADKAGTVQNQGAKLDNPFQPNHYGGTENARPVDTAPGQAPKGATLAGMPAHRFESPWGGPAIDSQGNADCQHGQEGFPNGRFSTGSRYGPGALPGGTPSGGNGMVSDPNYPILSGGTNVTRKLGITNLRDVP